jgi:hypothetical protein
MAEQDKTPWTMSVPAAGRKYYDLGRNASYRVARPYEKAQPGQIPTVWAGGKLRAVVSRLERMLSGEESK